MRLLALTILLFSFSAVAQEADKSDYFSRISGSFNGTSDIDWNTSGSSGTADTDSGYGGELAVGRSFDNIDLELAVGHRDNDFTQGYRYYGRDYELPGNIENFYVGVNGAYNFTDVAGFTPYIEGGLNLNHYEAKLDFGGLPLGDHDTVLGYQAGAGVSKDLGGVELFGGVRYFDSFSDPEFFGIEADVSGVEGRIGVTKRF